MTNPNRTAALTDSDLAAALGWNVRNVPARLTFLGHTVECSRCGGSGHFSFNRMTGTTCFKCNGRKRVLAPITAKLIATVKAEVEAGKLAPYLAEQAAIRDARAAIGPVVKRAEEALAYQWARYSAWSGKRHELECEAYEVFRTQGMANALFFGHEFRNGLHEVSMANLRDRAGRELDAVAALAEAQWRLSMIEALDREARAIDVTSERAA